MLMKYNHLSIDNTPIPLDGDLWWSVRFDCAPWLALVLGWIWCTSDAITTYKRSNSALATIYETSWQPTDYRSPINILQSGGRARSNNALLATRCDSNTILLRSDGDAWDIWLQFPVWLRCRRPLLIRLRCTRSDYDQIATCWLRSYKCMRRSDAIIDV